MSAVVRARRILIFVGKVLVLATFLVGLQTHTLQYAYGLVPVPYLVALTPFAGFIGYLWVSDLEEALALVLGTVVVTGVGTIVVLSMPMFVQELSVPEQNLLLGNALGESLLFTGLSLVLFSAGMGVAAVGRNEASLAVSRQQSVAVALVLLIVGGGLSIGIAQNFTSAVEQRDVEATVVSVDGVDGTVTIHLNVENRLSRPMEVASATLRIGERSPVSVTSFFDASVPSGGSRSLAVNTSCQELSDEGLSTDQSVNVSGQMEASAFNDHDLRIPVADTAIELPC